MTRVYCYNFMEQIYQWFEYRKKICWSFLLYLIKLSLKMIGWTEQEPETELSINFQSPILKRVATFFWHGLKPALLISHTLVDSLI